MKIPFVDLHAQYLSIKQDIDAASREIVRRLGAGGWLRFVVPAAFGGAIERLDFRSICLAR